MQEVRNIPVGIQSFETMQTVSYVYVNKTHFISKLEIVGGVFSSLLCRFGKSFFISTLQAYFEERKDLFTGLAIGKIKGGNSNEWKKYPVLKLDLNA